MGAIEIKVNTASLQSAIEDILRDYGDVVYEATAEGIKAAEKVLIKNLKAASPSIKNPPKGYVKKNFAKNWKGKTSRDKLRRYVGNTTTVTDKKGNEIPLANILEYSTTRGKPFIKKTHEASIDEMARAVVETIKREV